MLVILLPGSHLETALRHIGLQRQVQLLLLFVTLSTYVCFQVFFFNAWCGISFRQVLLLECLVYS
jgi:hypothetical protein